MGNSCGCYANKNSQAQVLSTLSLSTTIEKPCKINNQQLPLITPRISTDNDDVNETVCNETHITVDSESISVAPSNVARIYVVEPHNQALQQEEGGNGIEDADELIPSEDPVSLHPTANRDCSPKDNLIEAQLNEVSNNDRSREAITAGIKQNSEPSLVISTAVGNGRKRKRVMEDGGKKTTKKRRPARSSFNISLAASNPIHNLNDAGKSIANDKWNQYNKGMMDLMNRNNSSYCQNQYYDHSTSLGRKQRGFQKRESFQKRRFYYLSKNRNGEENHNAQRNSDRHQEDLIEYGISVFCEEQETKPKSIENIGSPSSLLVCSCTPELTTMTDSISDDGLQDYDRHDLSSTTTPDDGADAQQQLGCYSPGTTPVE